MKTKTSINKLLKAVSLTCLATISISSIACDFHDQGMFGYLGGFGPGHGGMRGTALSANNAQLKLDHTRKVTVNMLQEQSIDISYHLPVEFSNATLRFTHSEGLKLGVDDTVEMKELNGNFTLNYSALTPGKHHILVWADAIKQTLPYSKVQRIEVVVK